MTHSCQVLYGNIYYINMVFVYIINHKGVKSMNTKIIFKDKFSVIGKMGMGCSSNPAEWIPQIWDDANSNFAQIKSLVKYDENGNMQGLWGAMSDVDETFARWGDNGKYLAGCEVDNDSIAPDGFTKWTIPAQTYLVVNCDMASYGEIFNSVINDYIPKNSMTLVGAVHERYPQAGNPNVIELYFPIINETCFCQSCGMPMGQTDELYGTNADGSKNNEYCKYCFVDGNFLGDDTIEDMIECCIPFMVKDDGMTAQQARAILEEQLPKLKRWKNK